MNEIAADVRELRAQADAPSPAPKVAAGENPNLQTERDAGIPIAETNPSPPIASETTAATSPKVEARSESSPPDVRTPAPARERVDLPLLVDLRPELAAFTAAVTLQQQATVQALRQATEFCQNQQLQLERFRMQLERLESRMSHLAQRP